MLHLSLIRIRTRNTGWNRLDGMLVAVGLVDIIASMLASSTNINIFRILEPNADQPEYKSLIAIRMFRTLRVFRSLRPLRALSRSKMLKLVLDTVIESLSPLFNR